MRVGISESLEACLWILQTLLIDTAFDQKCGSRRQIVSVQDTEHRLRHVKE